MDNPKLIDKPFRELSKEDIRGMARVELSKRVPVEDMLRYYNIEPGDYRMGMVERGFRITRAEKLELAQIQNKDKVAIREDTTYEIPSWLVCAIEDVDFEIIDGYEFYDSEQLSVGRRRLVDRVYAYQRRIEFEKETVVSTDLKPMDLVAMRIYRGIDERELGVKTFKSRGDIRELEGLPYVSKETASLYMRVLKIKERHIKQLRDVMNGKSKVVNDDRTIPKLVKLSVWRRDKGKCTECSAKDKLHYHHIVRFADGGQNVEGNLTLLCASCHAEEHKGEKSYHMLKYMAEE